MYKALVRSHLDYCGTIYHIPALTSQTNLGVTLNSLMEKVERTQYQATLAITGTWQGSNRSKLRCKTSRYMNSFFPDAME